MAVDITIKCRSFKKRLNKRYEFIILIYVSNKHYNISLMRENYYIPMLLVSFVHSKHYQNYQYQEKWKISKITNRKESHIFVFEIFLDDGLINDKILFVFLRTYSCLDMCLVTMKYVQDMFEISWRQMENAHWSVKKKKCKTCLYSNILSWNERYIHFYSVYFKRLI